MADIRRAHTADLEPEVLAAARALLDDVFAGEMTDDDWEHALGGLHVTAWDGDELIGHASVVQRRLVSGGRALRTGYLEGMGVRADRRGRGVGAALMAKAERIIRAAYEVGALGSTDEALGFYAKRGWVRWEGRLSALTPRGVVPTPDEQGGVFVLPCAVPLEVTSELSVDWRDGDVW